MAKKIKLGLLGCGTVGTGVLKVLQENYHDIRAKHPAREYMLKAMENGKHVVTANKDVLAQFGKDMFDAAEKHDVDFMFEASVAGGIPIITPLKQCLTANKITELIGIVNGTTNYM